MRELIAVIGAILISVVLSVVLSRSSLVATRATNNARYAASYAAALNGTRTFFATNRTTILGQLSGTNATQFSIATLIAAGALDPSFQATTATGGTYCIDVRMLPTTPPTMQGRMTVVGETAPLSQIAASSVATEIAQASVGVVSGAAIIGPDVNQPLAAFTGPGACAPGQNSVAAIVSDGDILATGQYLSRVVIPGNPSANMMATMLAMGGNDITGGRHVVVQDVSTTGTAAANPGDVDAAGDFNGAGSMTIVKNGTIGGSLAVTGTAAAASFSATDFFQTSDDRYKTDWAPILDPCNTLARLTYGHFTWVATGVPDIGVAAQSLFADLPDLVRVADDGHLTVNYDGLIPVLIACVAQERMPAAVIRRPVHRRRHEG